MIWFSRWEADPVIKASALETWAREHDLFEGYAWESISGDSQTIWGITVINYCKITMPLIWGLRDKASDLFIENATEQQLSSFMHAMNHGTDQQREQTCEQAYEIMFPKQKQ